MCISRRPPPDNSAQIAAENERKRTARIAEGKAAIDNAFLGFNDDFYNQYQNDYTSFYNPQLTDQYDNARKRLTLQLAKTGNLTSSTGADQFGRLKKRFDTQQTGITNNALNAVQALRGNIDARKSQLYADNQSSADPGAAGVAAASAAQSLQPAQPISPLADTFSDLFTNAGNAAVLSSLNRPYKQGTGVQTFSGNSRGGPSVQYVN